MNIELKPISKRAKNRVNEHGNTFKFVEQRGGEILVRSLGNSWRGETWLGWFNIGKDALVIKEIN